MQPNKRKVTLGVTAQFLNRARIYLKVCDLDVGLKILFNATIKKDCLFDK